ncbi:hypothetical protein KKE68_05885 [Patescibacteria group bacterium]|nr:hypothetical protein [Patescibacteria group bacterium]
MLKANTLENENIAVSETIEFKSHLTRPDEASTDKSKKYIIAIILGIIFQPFSLFIAIMGMTSSSILESIIFTSLKLIPLIGSTAMLIYGLSKYAKKKGQDWTWGFAGFIGFLGFIIVCFLDDLHRPISTTTIPDINEITTTEKNSTEKKNPTKLQRFLVYLVVALINFLLAFSYAPFLASLIFVALSIIIIPISYIIIGVVVYLLSYKIFKIKLKGIDLILIIVLPIILDLVLIFYITHLPVVIPNRNSGRISF